jgi:hypothetical protein
LVKNTLYSIDFGNCGNPLRFSTGCYKKTAIGTSKTWGTVDGISVVGLVQGPSAAKADLQIACVFEYTEGDIFNPPALPKELNGMVHLDEALKGIITVRKRTVQRTCPGNLIN